MSTSDFQLLIDGVGPLHVHALRGKEGISDAWRFDVTATGLAEEDATRLALGQRAKLVLNVGTTPREFNGVVSAVRLDEVNSMAGAVRHSFRIVPRLWLLRNNQRTRIFQNKRIIDVVGEVLAAAQISVRWTLVRSYPSREYCTQYEESDYAFVRRLLAEAGIYFRFYEGASTGLEALAGGAMAAAAAATGGGVGGMVGNLLPLVAGDSVVCGDDALAYPSIGPDDPAALAAASTASLALGAADVAVAGVGLAGDAAAALLYKATQSSARSLQFMANKNSRVDWSDKVTSFQLQNSVKPTSFLVRDYDPDKPQVRLESAAVSTAPFPPSPLEITAMAEAAARNAAGAIELPAAVGVAADVAGAGVSAATGSQLAGAEVYQHHSPFLFPKWSWGSGEAPRVARQARRRASVAHGESGCVELRPGCRFALEGHLAPRLDAVYAVVTVRHEGNAGSTASDVYLNRFECVPAEMTYPPKLPPRRSVQVALTATVVGPENEDVYVDEQGRIKVEFHWDRAGRKGGASSCWIRTMQAWAGAGWGHQFIPRVGMEVVTIFEGGDPDKPMVLGSVFNGTHPAPFALPEDRTRSGIRTQSTSGKVGHNELSFEDRAGAEEVFLKAQRDFRRDVSNDVLKKAGGSSREEIGKSRSTVVGGDAEEQIGGSFHSVVRGAHYDIVKGARTSSVKGNHSLIVQGDMSVEVGSPTRPRIGEAFVHGDYALGASNLITLRSDTVIRLSCGSSELQITPDTVRIVADNLILEGNKSITARGNGPGLRLEDDAEITAKTIRFVSEKASVVLDRDTSIDGTQIRLNCKGVAPEVLTGTRDVKTKKLALHLTDDKFVVLAGKEYMLTAAGARFEGTTDGGGNVTLDVPEEARTASLTVFLEGRPEGRQLRYRIRLEPLPPIDTVLGIKSRLENLGYFWGTLDESFDAATQAALREFQKDHELTENGQADQATVAKLAELSGV